MILIKPEHRDFINTSRNGTKAIGLAQASDSSRFPLSGQTSSKSRAPRR